MTQEKKIFFKVVCVHLLFLLIAALSSFFISPSHLVKKTVHVNRVVIKEPQQVAPQKLQAQTPQNKDPAPKQQVVKPALTKPPAPKQQVAKAPPAQKKLPQPKKTEAPKPKKKEPPKQEKIVSTKQNNIEPPKPKRDIAFLQQAARSLESSGGKVATENTKKNLPLLPKMEQNGASQAESGAASYLTYEKRLVDFLRLQLRLPEFGDVVVEASLDSRGSLLQWQIVSFASEKNKTYVEKHFSGVRFPPFGTEFPGEHEKTFRLVLSQE